MTTWRRLKGLVYSAIVLVIIVLSTYVEARWQLYVAGIFAVVIFYVGEVHEIDVMNFATITFTSDGQEDDE